MVGGEYSVSVSERLSGRVCGRNKQAAIRKNRKTIFTDGLSI